MSTQQTQDIIEEFCQQDQYKENLVYVEETDSFIIYDEEHYFYKPLGKHNLRKAIFNFLRGTKKNFSRGLLSDMEEGLRYMCYRQIERLQKNYVAFQDGCINYDTLGVEPINKKNIAYHYLNYPTDSMHLPTPHWDKYVSEVIVDKYTLKTDETLVLVLQEMMGYYIIEEMKPEVFFFLYGGGSNGKSKLLEVIEKIIGKSYTKYRNLDSLTGYQFAAIDLLGQKLNIIRDDESKYIRVDKLKTLTSGESVTADRKNQGSIDFTPRAKVLCATNKMVTFSGLDYGLKRRLMFIPFYRKLLPHERDHTLEQKLESEIPGILNWALAGAKRLRENNYMFTPCKQIDDLMKEFEEEVSSAIEFIRQNYEINEDCFITNDEIYTEYDDWCRQNGRKKMSSKNFFKDIHEICPSVVTWSPVYSTTKRGRRLKRQELVAS